MKRPRWAQVCTASGSCTLPARKGSILVRCLIYQTHSKNLTAAASTERYVLQSAWHNHPLPGRNTDDAKRSTRLNWALSDDEIARRCQSSILAAMSCALPHIVFNVMIFLRRWTGLRKVWACQSLLRHCHFRTQGDLDGSDRIESHTLGALPNCGRNTY